MTALLSSGMLESQSRQVRLKFDAMALQCIVQYLEATHQTYLEDTLKHASVEVLNIMDYLQVNDNHAAVIQALHIFLELSKDDRDLSMLPSGRKKRYERFWACWLLCFQFFLPEKRMDQRAVTEQLQQIKDENAVTLRRELVEYGFLRRQGDGSEYWRPIYTVALMEKWLEGVPRRIV